MDENTAALSLSLSHTHTHTHTIDLLENKRHPFHLNLCLLDVLVPGSGCKKYANIKLITFYLVSKVKVQNLHLLRLLFGNFLGLILVNLIFWELKFSGLKLMAYFV